MRAEAIVFPHDALSDDDLRAGGGKFPVSGIFYFIQSVTDTIFISTSTILGNASTGIAS